MSEAVTIVSMAKRWADAAMRPLFKRRLISSDGCVCAQGDVLRCAGYTDEQLRSLTQNFADKAVAKILGISSAHSVLLREVNDSKDGCPQDVLMNPERVLGPRAADVLKFWLYLDTLTKEQWSASYSVNTSYGTEAEWAASTAVGSFMKYIAWRSAVEIHTRAAGWATNEIQGFYFLPKDAASPRFLKLFNYDFGSIQ